MNNIEKIINKIKKDTNNAEDITYRKKIISKKEIYIIYNESLTSSNTISDFIIRSLDNIKNKSTLIDTITNNIDNFKYSIINNYEDICYYLNYGFTIILIENENNYIVLETKRNLSRSISTPQTEKSLRAAMDSFVEDIQTNIGLIRRRIKTNDLWIDSNEIGKYTKTKVNI